MISPTIEARLSGCSSSRPRRGVAFILVLGVLAGLLVLASPFLAVALNDRETAGRALADAEANAHALGLAKFARKALERGHAANELGRPVPAQGGIDDFASPKWDREEEFRVPLDLVDRNGKPLLDADGRPFMETANVRGRLADLSVRDEQSSPNLWSSPPFLIAAYLARGTLAGDIEAESTELTLDTGEGFPAKGGALFVEGERIEYTERRGAQFLGLTRGAPPSGKARKHKAETWVIDDRARELATVPWKSPRAAGGFREPVSFGGAKEGVLFGGVPLTAVEVDRLARNFNVSAWRYLSEGFGVATGLVGNIDPAVADLADGFKIRVKSNDGINAGSVIRITDGVNVDYAFVLRSQRGGFATLTLEEATRNAYAEGRTFVSPMLRHPVNVNACSQETLVNLLQGLQVTGGNLNAGTNGRVTRIGAETFAKAIVEARPIRGWAELRNLLQSTVEAAPLITSPQEMVAIFRNAVDAGDSLLGTSTLPFCFASYDRYRIDAAVAVNDPSGKELARRRLRELVHVQPTFTQTFRLDSQEEFEDSILRARLSPWFTTYPNPVERPDVNGQTPASRIQRMLQFSLNAGAAKQAGTFPDKVEGDVRLLTARLDALGGFIEHMDGQAFGQPDNVDATKISPDGWDLSNGAFEVPTQSQGGGRGGPGRPGGGRRGGQNNSGGALVGQNGLFPNKVDFWLKLRQLGGRQVLFDIGGSNLDEQRAQVVLEADGSLRSRLRDRTLPNPATGFDETLETVYVPDAGVFKADTWFHLGMSYRGTKPDELALWLDGMKRGRPKFATTLTRSVTETATSFDCEDLTDWPDRGVAWVGREAVEYAKSGNTLQAIDYPGGLGATGRGRRGTASIAHGAGEPVVLLGYSSAVVSQANSGGVAIPRGGATLQSDLGPFNLASFSGNDMQSVNLAPPGAPPVTIQLEIHDPAKPNGSQLALVAGPGCPADFSCFQTTGGYAVIVSRFSFLPGPLQTALAAQGFVEGAELIYYSGRSGVTLTGLSAPNLAHFAGPTVTLGAGGLTLSTVRGKHPTRSLGGGPTANRPLVAVFPISVGVTNVEGYLEPIANGSNGNFPEFVSLGQPDFINASNHRVEWIRYVHRDTARNHLLCDDENDLGDAIGQAASALLNLGGQNAVVAPWAFVNGELKFRSQFGTALFGYDDPISPVRHSASEDVVPCVRVVQHDGIGTAPPPTGAPPGSPAQTTASAPVTGYGDSVTVEQAGGTLRKRFDVTWSADSDFGFHGLVSFSESANQVYSQRALQTNDEDRTRYTRLLKFPTGEMPAFAVRGTRARAGGEIDGATSGSFVDEIRISPFSVDRYIVWDQTAMGILAGTAGAVPGSTRTAVDETTDEIPLCGVEWVISRVGGAVQPGGIVNSGDRSVVLPDHRQVFFERELRGLPRNDAGLMQIDEEVIAFRRIGTGRNGGPALLGCQRGFMGTTAQKHGYGADATFLEVVPVTMLSAAASATDREFGVASPNDFGQQGGLALIDDELVHYSEIAGRSLRMPPRLDAENRESGGLLRGRFGTRPAAHDTESIVLGMPFRHWDRFAERQDNPEIAYYGFAIDAAGAYVDSFAFEEFRPNENVRLRALVRTEPEQRFGDEPGKGLLSFDGPAPADRPHRIDRGVSLFEARFMVQYESGSFDPFRHTQSEWKSTPELRWVEVKYRGAPRTLERESGR